VPCPFLVKVSPFSSILSVISFFYPFALILRIFLSYKRYCYNDNTKQI